MAIFWNWLRLGLINVVLKKIDLSKGFDPAEIKNSKECMICSICTIGFLKRLNYWKPSLKLSFWQFRKCEKCLDAKNAKKTKRPHAFKGYATSEIMIFWFF